MGYDVLHALCLDIIAQEETDMKNKKRLLLILAVMVAILY